MAKPEPVKCEIKPCPGCLYLDATNPRCMEDPDRHCFMWAEKPKAPVYDCPVLVLRFADQADRRLYEKLLALSAADGHELTDDILCILHDFAGNKLQKLRRKK